MPLIDDWEQEMALAGECIAEGDRQGARRHLERALGAARELQSRQCEAAALELLAELEYEELDFEAAQSRCVEALEAWKGLLGTSHPHMAWLQTFWALILQALGLHKINEMLLNKVRCDMPTGRLQQDDIATTLNNLAAAHLQAGRVDAAETALREAARVAVGPVSAAVLHNLGVLKARLGQWREAESLLLWAAQLLESEAGAHAPATNACAANLRILYRVIGREKASQETTGGPAQTGEPPSA